MLPSIGSWQMLVVYHLQKASGNSGGKLNVSLVTESFQRKISGSNGTSDKVVLFSGRNIPNGNSCWFLQSHLWYRFQAFAAVFSVTGTCTNAIPGRHLRVLNFHYHKPKAWIDRFAHVNGKQPLYPRPRSAGAASDMVVDHGYCRPVSADTDSSW